MNALKHRNMMASYGGFSGPVTVRAICDQIPDELYRCLTGRELGIVMQAINNAYHKGRAPLGGITKADDALWIPTKGDGGKMIPIAALKSMMIIPSDPPCAAYSKATRYTCDYVEGHW